ncbi:MAG: 3-hydroxyacyl-ACP dehydratase [Deltaproteobacteria bacterium HGW-Deltaproteobacteria-14]|nr:MAG: 3-hydroxyacyl-ACP dehydratase [Deltaproteobacteria bacterium HGW-Deltaproteobacteria-14]
MSKDYHPMWESLGLDLDAHDALLDFLGSYYADTFVAQPNRPAAMGYFDFVMSEVHGLRIEELLAAKAEGRKVIATFCTYVPEELILALDGVMVGLCAGASFAPELAEAVLPRTLCPLIKGFFGFALGRVCPYLAASDLVVGENTCDGKKKAWEIYGDMSERMVVFDLPQTKSSASRALLRGEYAAFARRLEEATGKTLTVAAFRRGAAIVNAKREALARLARLRAADPAPLSGLDGLLVNQIAFYDDPVRFTTQVHALCDELEQRIAAGVGVARRGAPRVLVSGCPMAVPNWKVPTLVERAGAVIVGEESCVGERGQRNTVDASADTLDGALDALVDRYLGIDCAIFTPNRSRLDHIGEMRAAYNAHGVLHYGLQFCQPYLMEAGPVEKALEGDGVPTLRVETDYGQEDVGQLQTRIEAFIERLEG